MQVKTQKAKGKRSGLRVLTFTFLLFTFALASAAEPTQAEIETRLREISLLYQKMESDLKAAQLTIRNIQLEVPALKAEEEGLRAKQKPVKGK